MPGRIYLPPEVQKSIGAHIRSAISAAVQSYLSAAADEDTLTGHLGGKLETPPRTVRTVEFGGVWVWSIDYTKFRGRGKAAEEKHIGADGVLELRLRNSDGELRKSALFQAKKELTSDERLYRQSLLLSTWREAAFIINYTPEAFEAISIDEVIRTGGVHPKIAQPLEKFLTDDFIECTTGDMDLRYDARAGRLQWRTTQEQMVAVRFPVRHRISANITAPDWHRKNDSREIKISEIHDYRMHVRPEDLFRVSPSATIEEIKQAKRRYALAYHPDRDDLDELFSLLRNRRMQEANTAFEHLVASRTKK